MMRQQRSAQDNAADESRVEFLLGLLRETAQRDPSPVLRERLSALYSERLIGRRSPVPVARGDSLRALAGFRPALITGLLFLIGLTVSLLAYRWQRAPLKADIHPSAVLPLAPPVDEMPLTASQSNRAPIKHGRAHRALVQRGNSQRMVLLLPYSNRDVANGTNSTIRVSMSQSELLSLGFPLTETLHDRRVNAELTLGDDGLPRAISVPLPLELIKEKR
jgi:hypothetical protein